MLLRTKKLLDKSLKLCNIKSAKEVILVFKVFESVLKYIANMFPKEVKTLNDFMDQVVENGNPVEIKPTFEMEVTQITDANNIPVIQVPIGRTYVVRLKTITKTGKEIVYNRIIGFLSEYSENSHRDKFSKKTSEQAAIITKWIKYKWPKISTKIVEA